MACKGKNRGCVTGRRFRILGIVGRGAYGRVHRAVLEGADGFEKTVAVKLLHPELDGDEEAVRRLRDEARVLGLVRHRAIVKVDALVRLDGRWALVMELVEGVQLRRLLELGPLPPGPALEIVIDVANALHAAYTQEAPDGRPLRLLHRDIKPANLQVTASGEVKLLDFGIARADYGTREADTGPEILGSLGYMAPERLDGIDGPAGDVYALGVVLWEMLMGRRLGRTSTRRIRHDVFLAEARADLLRAIGPSRVSILDLVLAMLAYDPAGRPCAKDVERRCRALRARTSGPWLADWAAGVVPTLRSSEEEVAPDTATVVARPRWAGLGASLLFGITLGAATAAGAVAGLWWVVG